MTLVLTLATLAGYLAVMLLITHWFARRGGSSTEEFTVADRSRGSGQGALSIAASWIWAPALFVASTQAYNNGWVGVFWFIVPNFLTLLLMIPFAKRLRARYPEGFTLSGFMAQRYGAKVQKLYQIEMGGLSILSISVNLLAGGTVLSLLSGLPLWLSALLLVLIACAYTLRHGIRSSLVTDAVQMVFILGALALFIPVALLANGGGAALVAGLNGVNNVTGFFSEAGIGVAVTFGIISAIGLMAGPIGDQSFWQRVFTIDRHKLARSFALGAVAFVLVPISMAVFGFIAAGNGMAVSNPGYVNLELIEQIFPVWVTVPFLVMLLSGLLSTVDSQMLALGSLTTDYTGRLSTQRAVIAVGTLLALGIALIPGNSVPVMFLIYGTLRAATFLITVLTLVDVRLRPVPTFVGILAAMVVGFPISIYGNVVVNDGARFWGTVLTVLLSGTVALVGSAFQNRRDDDRRRTDRVNQEISYADH